MINTNYLFSGFSFNWFHIVCFILYRSWYHIYHENHVPFSKSTIFLFSICPFVWVWLHIFGYCGCHCTSLLQKLCSIECDRSTALSFMFLRNSLSICILLSFATYICCTMERVFFFLFLFLFFFFGVISCVKCDLWFRKSGVVKLTRQAYCFGVFSVWRGEYEKNNALNNMTI